MDSEAEINLASRPVRKSQLDDMEIQTTTTVYLKEHQVVSKHGIGHLAASPVLQEFHPWSSSSHFTPKQQRYEKLKSLPHEQHADLSCFNVSDQSLQKQTGLTPFTISHGQERNTQGLKSAAISAPSVIPRLCNNNSFEIGFIQPAIISSEYSHVNRSYVAFSSYGPHFAGRVMLPSSFTADEGPVYVNAKQYHGIMRRRKHRAAKAEIDNKSLKEMKPYKHESRHRHAMRRPRGCGGRFLNTKTKLIPTTDHSNSRCTDSSSFEISDSNSTSDHNSIKSVFSISHVTSWFSREDLIHCTPENNRNA